MIVEELVSVLGLEIDSGDLNNFRSSIAATTTKIAGMVGVTLSAAAAINSLLTETANLAANSRFAQQIDVGFESLQRLEFAASQSGVSMGELQGSLISLRNAAQGAFTGFDQGAAESFALLGISVRDANNELKTADTLLLEVADRIANSENQAFDFQIAQRLGLGPNLNLLLEESSAGINRLGDEAERAGLILDGDAAKAAIKFDRELDRLSKTFRAFVVESGGPFLDWLIEATKTMTEFVGSGAGQAIGSAIGEMASSIGQLTAGSIDLLVKLSDALVEIGLPRTTQGLLVAGAAILAFFGPVGLAIAAFALAAEDLNKFLDGGPGAENTVTGQALPGVRNKLDQTRPVVQGIEQGLDQFLFHLTSGSYKPPGRSGLPVATLFGRPVGNAPGFAGDGAYNLRIETEVRLIGDVDPAKVARAIEQENGDGFREAFEAFVSGFGN